MVENAIDAAPSTTLYDDDFVAWTEAQAAALRAGPKAIAALDWANLAEEIADLGSEQIHAMESYARLIFTHLLYLAHGGDDPQRHWRTEIVNWRGELARRLRRNPGQRQRVDLDDSWALAARAAAVKLNRPELRTLGERPAPLTLEQLEDEDGEIDALLAEIPQ